jgi:nucleoside-diphosphate-sugar epimerase
MDPVLVTGTSGLVGYQVALRLHEAGTDVLGLDIRPAGSPTSSRMPGRSTPSRAPWPGART